MTAERPTVSAVTTILAAVERLVAGVEITSSDDLELLLVEIPRLRAEILAVPGESVPADTVGELVIGSSVAQVLVALIAARELVHHVKRAVDDPERASLIRLDRVFRQKLSMLVASVDALDQHHAAERERWFARTEVKP